MIVNHTCKPIDFSNSHSFICYKSSIIFVRDSTSTDEQYSRDCALMDSLAQQQSVEQVFPSNIVILPVDIKRSLEKAMLSNADRYV